MALELYPWSLHQWTGFRTGCIFVGTTGCSCAANREVRSAEDDWLIDYNECRPHDSLCSVPPAVLNHEVSTSELSTYRGSFVATPGVPSLLGTERESRGLRTWRRCSKACRP